MTHELYYQCVIACLIGNIIHIAFKVRSLAVDHKVANLQFSLGGYLKDDKWALIVDALSSFGLVFVADEWLDMDPRILGKIKSIFILVGFSGSYMILQLMSVAKSNFRKSIDFKTDKSDALDGTLGTPTPTSPTKP